MFEWLCLFYTKNIGNKWLAHLIKQFGSAKVAYEASNADWKKAGLPDSVIASRTNDVEKSAASAIKWFESSENRHILTIDDARYPELLKIVDDAPMILFVEGNPSILSAPQLGMVGSRHPTKEGEQNAYEFSKALSQYGIVITSGLAMGIDTYAHKGCADFNRPTIAVLGTGLNKIYPQQNQILSQEIVEKGGCLVSEFPLLTPPIANNFPKRNRIIAGLSLGVLVVEAAKQSGSLITARMAGEYSREVFAIPSSIHNPQSKGCHLLIRQGAKLVENVGDIYEEFKYWLPNESFTSEVSSYPSNDISASKLIIKPEDSFQRKIFDQLSVPLTIDELIIVLNESSESITQAILMMEIEGFITRLEGGRYQVNYT